MTSLPKAYIPKDYEDDIYDRWENSGLFNPDVCVEKGVTDADAEAFSIVLPPPNVTGTLHMGHAVMLAIEDVMIRYQRMKGKKALWVPGTDHAAVATESKVEKILINEGTDKPKETLGREAFLERVRQFAQESHDTIVNQARKMGASLDWKREAFTLDETRHQMVSMVFKKMYDDGLIYRGYRVINWSVKGQSTCSDDELVYVERPAKLYTFKYSKDIPITIATTRPETKLGDTAIAVHPEGRWKDYIGQTFTVENFGQDGHTLTLQVIGDDGIDDNFGTGALGVTTAHSPIDFAMYEKQKALGNDIGLIQVIGEDGKMTTNAGEAYVGLSVSEAREKVVAWLNDEGLMQKEAEDIMQNAGTSDRFKDVVEPLPKTQWFIDVNKPFTLPVSQIAGIKAGQEVTLKQLMQHVVRSNQIEIIPDRFQKTYFSWIDNLRDWCISRQIWYGHQIPVWYKDDEVYCGVQAPAEEGWTQDPDTLDTWFSSGMWTFSTLMDDVKEGETLEEWIARSEDLKTFHPTGVLETGYDIIFFWVARMILMTTYTLGDIPFKQVFLHGMVRDEQGRKMSKSLDNIINPLDMINQYGTDATRLSLLVGSTPGTDTKLSEEKIAGYRNFTNKLWNISRFLLMNIDDVQKETTAPETKTASDAWILWKLNDLVHKTNAGLDKHDFSAVGEMLRDFTWNDLADWYLEIAKVEGDKSRVLNHVLNTLLKLWHPFMPFVTEAIWKEVYGEDAMLMVECFPEAAATEASDAVQFVDGNLRDLITAIRSLRADKGIAPGKMLTAYILTDDQQFLDENAAVIKSLARLESLTVTNTLEKSPSMASSVLGAIEVVVDFDGAIDTEKEKARLEKEIANVAPYVTAQEKKLSNAGFVDNAPEAVVEAEKEKLKEAKEKLVKLEEQLKNL